MDAASASPSRALSPSSFRHRHLRPNAPVVLPGLTEKWRAAEEWRIKNNAPSCSSATACAASPVDACASRASASDPAAVRRRLLRAKRIITTATVNSVGDAADSNAAATAVPALAPHFRLPPPPSTPNFARLRELFAVHADGQPHLVSVAQCFGRQDSEQTESNRECGDAQSQSHQQQQPQTTASGSCALQPMDSFLRDWEQIVADRAAHPAAAIDRRRLRYLKDWHLVLTHPHYDAYSPPLHFADDWMNSSMHDQGGGDDEGGDDSKGLNDASASTAAPGENQAAASADPLGDDDFRFCYMGPAGTWTPMHTDVYNSFSWSANVVGRKLWVLFAPEWRPVLTQHGQLISDVLSIESSDPDELGLSLEHLTRSATRDGVAATTAAPGGAVAAVAADDGDGDAAGSLRLPECFVWLQEEGETIFVPSGWLHQVHNLDDCVSINHNWMNACNLPNMFAFLMGEWTAALAAVSGFDFDAGPGAAVSSSSAAAAVASSSSAAPGVSSPDLDDATLGNGWRVMAANVGMSWSQFAHFLRFHRARLQRMRVRALRLSSSDTAAAPTPTPVEPAPFTLPLDVVDFSLQRIDEVEAAMRDAGFNTLIARWQRLCDAGAEAAADADADPVGQLQQQLSRAQIGERTAGDCAAAAREVEAQEEDDAVAQFSSGADEGESSEEEFVPRHLRPAEGRKRRARIIRDDSDEVDSEPDGEVEERLPSASGSPLLRPSLPLHPPPSLQCTCPVHPAVPAAARSAGRVVDEEEEVKEEQQESGGLVSASSLSYLLRLFFQEVHVAVGLPFLPAVPLDAIAAYAAPVTTGAWTAVAPSAAASAASASSSSSSSCAAPSSSSVRRAGRGPFFVVSTHYANGDTFSETHGDEGALMRAAREYAAAAMVRALEAEAEGADESELKRAVRALQRMLDQMQAGTTNSAPPSGGTADASASAPGPSPPSSALDVVLELALDIGDELIQSQLGYGWTMVHECGVDD